jgi:serine/threonine protein kinase
MECILTPGFLRRRHSVNILLPYFTEGDLLALALRHENCGGVAESTVAILMYQLCTAVSHMHSHHVVHRDIKPENCLLHNGNLILFDFALSEFVLDDFVLSKRDYTGSSIYRAPETIYGKSYQTRGDLADAWGIGLTTFVLLAGRFPFTEKALQDNYSGFLNGGNAVAIPRPRGTIGAMQFVDDCMHFDTRCRLTPTQLVHHLWFQPPL